MNRTILFRGKRIDTGEWAYGDLVSPSGENEDYGIAQEEYLNEHGDIGVVYHQVDPETVGQYTGLTDKNGKQVFEGDVFRQELPPDDDEEQPFVARSLVVFDEVGFAESCIGKRGLGAPLYLGEYCDLDAEASAWEVIGNIHDNPELLEGGGR